MSAIIENATFKEDLYGFYLNDIFNGFKYDVGTPNDESIELKSQSKTGGMVVDLSTITLLDKDDVDITPGDTQLKARELSKIVSRPITEAYITAVVEDVFGITPV